MLHAGVTCLRGRGLSAGVEWRVSRMAMLLFYLEEDFCIWFLNQNFYYAIPRGWTINILKFPKRASERAVPVLYKLVYFIISCVTDKLLPEQIRRSISSGYSAHFEP